MKKIKIKDPTLIGNSLQERLPWLRKYLDLTPQELSRSVQIKKSTLNSYENKSFPLVEALARFQKLFALDLNWLLFGYGKIFMDGGTKARSYDREQVQFPEVRPIVIDPLTSKRIREIRLFLKKDLRVFAMDLGIGTIDLREIEDSNKSLRRRALENLFSKFKVNMNHLISGSEEMFLPAPITKQEQPQKKKKMPKQKWKKEQFEELLLKNRTLRDEIKEAKETLENNSQKMMKLFFPKLEEIYQDWSPQLKEDIVLVDLEHDYAFSGVISHLRSNILQVQVSEMTFYSVSLPLDLEDYQGAKVILPQSCYSEFQELFGEIKKFSGGLQEILGNENLDLGIHLEELAFPET